MLPLISHLALSVCWTGQGILPLTFFYMSPWLGKLGDHSLTPLTLNKVLITIFTDDGEDLNYLCTVTKEKSRAWSPDL